MTVAVKLEHVVARGMSVLRAERGWTQAHLAWRMTEMGMAWTANRVAQLETLRRPMSLLEITALCWVFEVPVWRFADGDDLVELPSGGAVPVAQIRAAWQGDAFAQVRGRQVLEHQRSRKEELRKIAKRLGVEPGMLNWISRQTYGRGFVEERDDRAGDVADLPKRSAQTKRGHATRTLIAEVQAYLDEHGRDETVRRYREHVADVVEKRS